MHQNIGQGKLNAIKSSWLQHWLYLCWEASFTPHNTTSLADVELVVRFILHYVEYNAILLPGHVPQCKHDDLLFSPTMTKKEVEELHHRAASSSAGSQAVGYCLFC